MTSKKLRVDVLFGNRTAELAVELASSAFGKKIL